MKTIELIQAAEELGFKGVENTPESSNIRVKLWALAMVAHSIAMTGTPASNDMRVALNNRISSLDREIVSQGGIYRNHLIKLLGDIKEVMSDI